jgi:hypothetical protein
VIVALAVARADIRTCARGPGMSARSHTIMIDPAARTNRRNMRTGVHAMVADTGTGTHHRSSMTAGADAVGTNIAARANTADMCARTHAMTVNMCPNTDTQHIDAKIDGMRAWREQNHGAKSGGDIFHSVNPYSGGIVTAAVSGSS